MPKRPHARMQTQGLKRDTAVTSEIGEMGSEFFSPRHLREEGAAGSVERLAAPALLSLVPTSALVPVMVLVPNPLLVQHLFPVPVPTLAPCPYPGLNPCPVPVPVPIPAPAPAPTSGPDTYPSPCSCPSTPPRF
ncbi:cyclin-dependent kinase inhibitor 1C-like [Penaeus indicus]|uniref:cyclin-dependent kinase inhibitor 1C-like n=1 Tax=Penaeus indicus TaxID=29960 RepID=UPI00300D84E3